MTFESKVDTQGGVILKTDPEFWEIRQKALGALLNALDDYSSNDSSLSSVFTPNAFRLLKEPIRSMVY